MAWPTTGAGSASSGYVASGVTTILWGSKGVLQAIDSADASYLTVLSAEQRPLVDKQHWPNGDGLTTTRTMILDGQQWDLKVREDTRMSIPSVGATCRVVDMAGKMGVRGKVYDAVVIDSPFSTAPKQPGETSISLENLLLVESQTGGAQA